MCWGVAACECIHLEMEGDVVSAGTGIGLSVASATF
jgi:hypothetical protein